MEGWVDGWVAPIIYSSYHILTTGFQLRSDMREREHAGDDVRPALFDLCDVYLDHVGYWCWTWAR